MPFFNASSLEKVKLSTGNPGEYQSMAGEMMKAGVVTYHKGTGSKPHWHENEEQYIYVLEGKRLFRVGDEEKVIGPGDIVHIPRGSLHGGRTLAGEPSPIRR
jgi:quercetin dioxygenase-like cupin family protein